MTDLKIPPHSIDAEQSVLGGLLLANESWDDVADRISEEDFYRFDHRLIYKAIRSLAELDRPVDVITLSEWLEERGELDDAGGLAYLGSLAKDTPSAANIKAYADIVRERSILRQLIAAGTSIADSAFSANGRDVKELLDAAQTRVMSLAEEKRGGPRIVKSYLKAFVEDQERRFESENGMVGLPSGFDDIDEMTNGFEKGDLIIIAGRPSMGKSALAMNIAENAAVHNGVPVMVFSMEMPAQQLVRRVVSSTQKIPNSQLMAGKLEELEWVKFSNAVTTLTEAPLIIDEDPGLSVMEIRARARRVSRTHGVGLIIVDYLQLMRGEGETRQMEVAGISSGLKALAKELDVPVIALSQLNRSLEQRPNKRPVMSDLRESGSIEQDADVIAFIYRDEVYNEDSPNKGTAEIIFRKQRNGPTGTVRLTFLKEYSRFENFAPEVHMPRAVAGVPAYNYED